jgi:hypothetical protein
MKITNDMRTIAALATKAEGKGYRRTVTAYHEMLGRMDRTFDGDGYDDQETREAAIARGMTRARAIMGDAPVAAASTTDVDLFASVHVSGEC